MCVFEKGSDVMGRYRGEDLVGKQFGKLTVIARHGTNEHRQALWRCACSCGGETVLPTSALKSGGTKSCGCLAHQAKSRSWRGDYTVTYNGKTQTVSEWAEEVGINYFTLYRRLERGWDIEKALFTGSTVQGVQGVLR